MKILYMEYIPEVMPYVFIAYAILLIPMVISRTYCVAYKFITGRAQLDPYARIFMKSPTNRLCNILFATPGFPPTNDLMFEYMLSIFNHSILITGTALLILVWPLALILLVSYMCLRVARHFYRKSRK